MAKTLAEQFVEILAAAGVKRIYGIVGDSLNGLTDCHPPPGQDRVDPCPARGGRGVRGRRRGASDRRARRLRRQLRAGQSAPHQRPVRLPPLARAGARHRRAYSLGRDRQRLFPGDASANSCSSECSHYCELVSGANQMPRVLEIAIREAVGKRGVSVVVMPGDVALQPAADAPPAKVEGLLPLRARRRARAGRSRAARGAAQRATSASRSCAARDAGRA